MNTKQITARALPIALFVIFLILPIFELIALISGLDFRLYNEIFICITQAVLAIGATVAVFVMKLKFTAVDRVFLILAAPLALLNAICLANGEWGGTVIFAILSAVAVFVLYSKFVPDGNGKAASAVFSVLFAIAFSVIFVWGLIDGAFIDKRTEKSRYTSVEGTYIASLGTSESLISTKTTVYVSKVESEFGVLFGSYWQKPVLVYEGEDYEVKTAVLSWLDDSTLIINDKEYKIGNQEAE